MQPLLTNSLHSSLSVCSCVCHARPSSLVSSLVSLRSRLLWLVWYSPYSASAPPSHPRPPALGPLFSLSLSLESVPLSLALLHSLSLSRLALSAPSAGRAHLLASCTVPLHLHSLTTHPTTPSAPLQLDNRGGLALALSRHLHLPSRLFNRGPTAAHSHSISRIAV